MKILKVLLIALAVMISATALAASSAGIVRGKVTDDNSQLLVCSILIEGEDGATYRQTTNAMGGYSLNLEPGTWKLTFTKGNEFTTVTRTVEVESLKTYYQQDVRLTAVSDAYAEGWLAGDCHQHTYYSDGVDSVMSSALGNAALGLYWGFLTDHNTSRGVPEWNEVLVNVRTVDGQDRLFCGFDGVEVTTEFGHYNSLGSGLTLDTYDIKLTEFERASSDKLLYARDKIRYIADCIKRVGGLAQMNHPYSSTTMGMANWIAQDDYETFDLFDTIEIWNGYFLPPDGIYTTENAMNQNYSAKLMWFRLLNAMKDGHPFHAATGGTDNHDTTAPVSASSHEKYTSKLPENLEEYYNYWVCTAKYNGMPTTYIHLSAEDLTMENVQQCLKEGRSFITDGPIVICDIDGKSYGETVAAQPGETLVLNTHITNRDGISQIRVVINGETVETICPDENTAEYNQPISLTRDWETNDWIVVEVLGPITQYAITNPIRIE